MTVQLPIGKGQYTEYEPLKTVEYTAECNGFVRTWKEYIPSSYVSGCNMPLVLSLHGGNSKYGKNLHIGDQRTAFTSVAEEYGFIVVFPQSLTEEIAWNVWELYDDDFGTAYSNDIDYIDWLIDILLKKYSIDKNKIYLHGQSLGDVMATEYALKRFDRIAAACFTSGACNASAFTNDKGQCLFGKESALPVVRIHGSEDVLTPSGKWMHVTENSNEGGRCNPVKDLIMQQGGISDEARRLKMQLQNLPNNLLWQHINQTSSVPVFSVRGNLNIISYYGVEPFHYVIEECGEHTPFKDFAEYIWKYHFAKTEAFIPDRDSLITCVGLAKAIINNELTDFEQPLIKCEADIPEFIENAEKVGKKVSCGYGIYYVSDHVGEISFDMAYIVKEILGLEARKTLNDCLELERKLLAEYGLDVPDYPDRCRI